jgi:hypothetical protein
MAEDVTGRVEVLVERSPACPVVVATGAVGSITPDGLISLQMYVDRGSLPRSLVLEQRAPGVVEQVGQNGPEAPITRTIVAEVLITMQGAQQFGSLIEKVIDTFRAAQEAASSAASEASTR